MNAPDTKFARPESIGDIVVHRGEPAAFPRLGGLIGDERKAALDSLRDWQANNVVWDEGGRSRSEPLSAYTFWYAPFLAASRRVSVREYREAATPWKSLAWCEARGVHVVTVPGPEHVECEVCEAWIGAGMTALEAGGGAAALVHVCTGCAPTLPTLAECEGEPEGGAR